LNINGGCGVLQEKHEYESLSDLLFDLARVSREERASYLPFQDKIGGILSLICWGKHGQDVGGETTRVPEGQIKSLRLVIGLRAEVRYYQVTRMCTVERGIEGEVADLWEDLKLPP